ncbi:MAG TPA: iron-containing redox enzyme family protein [Gammaproteobacteria bacterium]|nr:iron-containing redox enzyme family protein [Gammaproteobacteria bacterium]
MAEPRALARPEVLSALGQTTLRHLLRAWFDFERRLSRVPIIQRLEAGTFGRADYQKLLLHLRQQVIEGSRWIARAASSFDRDHADVRSAVIGHAHDEHRDYEVLEADFAAAGGDLDALRAQPRNPGSEALHGYLMHRAGEPNPVGLLGAMWIVEGLGEKMAKDWAARIEQLVPVGRDATRFLRYHGANDDAHLNKLYGLLDRLCTTDSIAQDIVRTAVVVGRLYALQLEEIDAA